MLNNVPGVSVCLADLPEPLNRSVVRWSRFTFGLVIRENLENEKATAQFRNVSGQN